MTRSGNFNLALDVSVIMENLVLVHHQPSGSVVVLLRLLRPVSFAVNH